MKKGFSVLICLILLTGCNLFEGSKGSTGAQGTAGIDGTDGANGTNGISCWDLNENGVKDVATEDINRDGLVNVMDCQPIKVSQPVVTHDVDTNTISARHTRTMYNTAGGSTDSTATHLTVYTGTYADYTSAVNSKSYSDLNQYVASPVQNDQCGIWYWFEVTPGNWQLKADNANAYRVEHMPVATSGTDHDGNPVSHNGYEDCSSYCLSDENCVAAFYVQVNDFDGTLNCTLLYDVGNEITADYEFSAVDTMLPGYFVANMATSQPYVGIISVCD